MSRIGTVALVLFALALPAAAQSDRRVLLRTSFANGNDKNRAQKPKRARFVEPDFAALEAPSMRRNEHATLERNLTVALFDDTVLHIELDRVEKNGVDAIVWSGRIEGEPSSSVDIVVKDGEMMATISTLTQRFIIEPAANGAHEALELDLAAFPAELEPIQPMTSTATAAPGAIVANDTAQFVDVLVVYTDDVRAYLGSTAAAQAAASSAVAAANTAYQNSGVTMRMRLAGTLEVAYNDDGNIGTALTALRNTNDGVIDNVHTVRNQVGADAVSMLVLNGGGSCGVGYVMSPTSAAFASDAFDVVVYSCAVGNLSFPHELGHNFGLEHDRFVSPGATPSYPYAFGYVDTQLQFRDIMAYGNACNGCTRVQYFSSPDLTYLGRPLGVNYLASNSADNVRALNNNALTIANFRQAVLTGGGGTWTPATFSNDPLVARSTVVRASHITELRTAINNYRTFAGLGTVTWSSLAAGTRVTAAQITELRSALTPALSALSRTVAFTNNPLTAGTQIRAVHIQELRNYLK